MKGLHNRFCAMRVNAISFGLLCGLTGIIAGVFECMQGPLSSSTFKISTIGTTHSMWEHSTYKAYSLFSDFQTIGIITIIVSIAVCFWSVFLIHKRSGSWGFLALSILQLLSGGAFVIDMALITFLVSLGIGKPLLWWGKKLPFRLQTILYVAWPWSLALYILVSIGLLLLTILGTDNGDLLDIIVPLAGVMFIPILFMIFGGIATDLKNQEVVT